MNIMEDSERDQILSKLNSTQRDFVKSFVKRGKKTAFANVLALDKGIVLPDSSTVEEREMILDEWILDEFIDNGFVNPATPCECGRPLRYQYIVKHVTTNEVRRFGMTHFEEHTGFPPSIVSAVKKGFTKIDYEQDELLAKIKGGWNLHEDVTDFPIGFKVSKDIEEHLHAEIPLLERQIKRLLLDINHFERTSRDEFRKNETVLPKSSKATAAEPFSPNDVEQITLDLFTIQPEVSEEIDEKVHIARKSTLDVSLKTAINAYLNKGVASARILSELLIKHHQLDNKRYITGKPKIYGVVCQYLDELMVEGKIVLTEVDGTVDRTYHKVAE